MRAALGLARDHRVEGLALALPALVAVHGVIAAVDRSDLGHAVFAHFLLELAEEINAALGRRVAAVHEAVDENVRDFILARHAQQGEQMLQLRMNAAVADETHQMQLTRAAAFHRFEQERLAEEFAAGDELIHARDVHLHDAAGADIQVAHFAIAHLPFGQTDEGAGGVDQRIGKILEQAVVVGLASEGNGVALGLRAIAPAVEHS